MRFALRKYGLKNAVVQKDAPIHRILFRDGTPVKIEEHIKYLVDIVTNWTMPDSVTLDDIATAHQNGIIQRSCDDLPCGVAPVKPSLSGGPLAKIQSHL